MGHFVDVVDEGVDHPVSEGVLGEVETYHFGHRVPELVQNIVRKLASDQFYCLHLLAFQVFQHARHILVSQLAVCKIQHIQTITHQTLHHLLVFWRNFYRLGLLLRLISSV